MTSNQLLERVRKLVLGWGLTLPTAALLSLGLSDVSPVLARLNAVAWLLDGAMVLSVPWQVVATMLAILNWRDLPQRFWIVYCINGLLAYNAFPLYWLYLRIHL